MILFNYFLIIILILNLTLNNFIRRLIITLEYFILSIHFSILLP